MSEIEESLKRITSHAGVMGVAVLDDAGKLARYSLPQVPNPPPFHRIHENARAWRQRTRDLETVMPCFFVPGRARPHGNA